MANAPRIPSSAGKVNFARRIRLGGGPNPPARGGPSPLPQTGKRWAPKRSTY